MSVDLLKSIFDWATIILIALTVFSGAGALITGDIIGRRQEAMLRKFDTDLTDAKKQVENLRGDNLKLEAKALSLQTELLKQGPRANLLIGETRRELVDALEAFPGQKIDVRRTAMLGQ